MPDILALLKEQGFESLDAAFEHLKTLKEAKEAAKAAHASGDVLDEEKAKRIISEVIDQKLAALGAKAESAKNVANPSDEAQENEVAELRKDMFWLAHIMRRSPRELDVELIARGYKHAHGREFRPGSIRKALDTTQHSAVVPTELSRALLSDVESLSPVMANLRILPMPANPWEMPYQSSHMTIYGIDEATEDSASAVKVSDLGLNKVTLTANKLGARALWSRELEEDAAVAILPVVREDFVRITREGWERNFLLGDETADTTNINKVGGTPSTTAGAKDPWLQTDGMVHHCIVNNTGQAKSFGGAFTVPLFLQTRKLMGKYGDKPGDLLIFAVRDLAYDIMGLDQFLTIDKYGDKATLVTGELGRICGSPLLVSDGLVLTAADGKVSATPADNVKKSFIIVNRVVGVVGGRRGEDLRIAVDSIIKTDQTEGVVYSRYDIGFPWTQAVAYGYNIT